MFIAVKQGPVCTQLFYVCAFVIELYYLTVIYAVSAACADMKTTEGGRRVARARYRPVLRCGAGTDSNFPRDTRGFAVWNLVMLSACSPAASAR
jgi:hypothetical protein